MVGSIDARNLGLLWKLISDARLGSSADPEALGGFRHGPLGAGQPEVIASGVRPGMPLQSSSSSDRSRQSRSSPSNLRGPDGNDPGL